MNNSIYFTDGQQTQNLLVPSDKSALELFLEPNHVPFFVAPTELRGTHGLITEQGEPYRAIHLNSPIAKQETRIETYTSVEQALYAITPATLPHHRDNLAAFLASVPDHDFKLQLKGKSTEATLYFHQGSAIAAKVHEPHDLRSTQALGAIYLLFNTEPLKFTVEHFDFENQPNEIVNAGFNSVPAASIPARAYSMWDRLGNGQHHLAELLFNISLSGPAPSRIRPERCALGLELENSSFGILYFGEKGYCAGVTRNGATGDDALAETIRLYCQGLLDIRELNLPQDYESRLLTRAPAKRTTLALAASSLPA